MSFIEVFFDKNDTNIKKEDIQKFIDEKIEENLNLDYKHINSYFNMDELARDVSAFANSAGGLIILGINEKHEKDGKNHTIKIFPEKITWGEKTLSKEKLEDNLISKIQPRINELKIIPIRNKDKEVIFLIDIPQSENPPHRGFDNYYKRLNFRRVFMEHYEISDFFGRRRKPNLLIRIFCTKIENVNQKNKIRFRIVLTNIGKEMSNVQQVILKLSNGNIVYNNTNMKNISFLYDDEEVMQYTSKRVCFPNVNNNLGVIDLEIEPHLDLKIESNIFSDNMKEKIAIAYVSIKEIELIKKLLNEDVKEYELAIDIF